MQDTEASTAKETQQEQMDKIMDMSRKGKRARLRIRHGAVNRPSARVRSGLPTGTTPHFKMWMADLRAHSMLQRLKLDAIADAAETPVSAAQGFALLFVGGVKSVADLQRRNISELLAIQGIGLKRLEAVEKYLTDRRIALAWTAA